MVTYASNSVNVFVCNKYLDDSTDWKFFDCFVLDKPHRTEYIGRADGLLTLSAESFVFSQLDKPPRAEYIEKEPMASNSALSLCKLQYILFWSTVGLYSRGPFRDIKEHNRGWALGIAVAFLVANLVLYAVPTLMYFSMRTHYIVL